MGKETTKVDTKVVKNPDGSTTKTVTTTTTTTNEDGSSSTKQTVQVFVEGIPGGGGGGGAGAGRSGSSGNYGGGNKNLPPGTVSTSEAAKQMKNAKRVPNTTDKGFINDYLEAANKLRAKHGIGPAKISDDLNQVAQGWANHLAHHGQMAHSTNGFGENVFWASGGNVTGDHVAKAWYSEIKDFNFNHIDHTPGTGHFTQLLWKDSVRVGVAMAKGKGGVFVVANYDPPGNFLGKYKENIFPPQK